MLLAVKRWLSRARRASPRYRKTRWRPKTNRQHGCSGKEAEQDLRALSHGKQEPPRFRQIIAFTNVCRKLRFGVSPPCQPYSVPPLAKKPSHLGLCSPVGNKRNLSCSFLHRCAIVLKETCPSMPQFTTSPHIQRTYRNDIMCSDDVVKNHTSARPPSNAQRKQVEFEKTRGCRERAAGHANLNVCL